jgi:hypothetical protein
MLMNNIQKVVSFLKENSRDSIFRKQHVELHEMAGVGKRGPKTKEQKAAEASAAAEKADRDKAYEEKRKRINDYHDKEYAPKHTSAFLSGLHTHLTNTLGYQHVHSGNKKEIYNHLDPHKERQTTVTVTKPSTDSSHWNKHNVEVRMVRSNGASFSSINYRPSAYTSYHHIEGQHDKFKEGEAEEATNRLKHYEDISQRTHSRDFGDD